MSNKKSKLSFKCRQTEKERDIVQKLQLFTYFQAKTKEEYLVYKTILKY